MWGRMVGVVAAAAATEQCSYQQGGRQAGKSFPQMNIWAPQEGPVHSGEGVSPLC